MSRQAGGPYPYGYYPAGPYPVPPPSTTVTAPGGGQPGAAQMKNAFESFLNSQGHLPPPSTASASAHNNNNTGSGLPDRIHNGQPWQCGCGERLSGDRARCGKCKKWRGGYAPARKRKVLPTQHTVSGLAAGISGFGSRTSAVYPTPIWTNADHPKKYASSEPSCTQSEVENLIHDPSKYQGTLLGRPSVMWQRPLFRVVGRTQPKTPQEKQT